MTDNQERTAVNTDGSGDVLILLVLLMGAEVVLRPLDWAGMWVGSALGSLARVGPGVIGRPARTLASWLSEPGAAGEVRRWLLMGPFVVLVLAFLGRRALGRVVGLKRYEVGRAAFMAVAGVPVAAVAAISVLAIGTGVADEIGLGWLVHRMALLVFAVPPGIAGLWSGWRFGRWGWAWGMAGIALIGALAFWLGGAEMRSPFDGVNGLTALASGALGGWFGARWFQRSLRKQHPAPQHIPADSGSQ